jgi:hypothetical protein
MTDTNKPSGSEEDGPGNEAETSKPAEAELFSTTIVPATAEDYEKGFGIGFMCGTWRDQQSMTALMSDSPDRPRDRLRAEKAKDHTEPGA